MFRSHAVSSQWDTWAFVENETFYAYYLITGDGSPGDGFGVATSGNGATGHVGDMVTTRNELYYSTGL